MKTVIRFCCVFFMVFVASCVPITQQSTEPISPQKSEESATPTANAGLTIEVLKAMSFLSPSFDMTVQLKGGSFTDGEKSISLLPQVAIGDLNGDHVDDAAVLLAENGGGTGDFVSLVVIVSQDGQNIQVGSALIDDRPVIESLTIENGAILLEALIHGINDPMVSPTLKVNQTYKLLENNLMMVSQVSTMQGGTERSITIDAPLDGSEVSGNVQLKGGMSVAPFENSLSFRILDLAGTELYSDGFMVSSADLGEPAIFDNEIALPTLPSGIWVRLELAELSMADGSVMAMDSVVVKNK